MSFSRSLPGKDVAGLYAVWATRERDSWATQPKLYGALAQRLLRAGEPLLAFDVTREASGLWPQDAELQVLQALALARGQGDRSRQRAARRFVRSGPSRRRKKRSARWRAPTRICGRPPAIPDSSRNTWRAPRRCMASPLPAIRRRAIGAASTRRPLRLLLGDNAAATRTAQAVQATCAQARRGRSQARGSVLARGDAR